MILDPKYNIDLPVSYVRASLLADTINAYANNPERRSDSVWYSTADWQGKKSPLNALTRYVDPADLTFNRYSASVNKVVQYLPDEIARLGEDFLSDVASLSFYSGYWWSSHPKISGTGPTSRRPPMTSHGISRVKGIISKYNLEGVSQMNGLAALLG